MESKSDWIGVWAEPEFFRPAAVRKILAAGGLCNFPKSGEEPDDEKMMTVIDTVHGYYIFGKQVAKDNYHGVVIRSTSGKTVDLMIPWHFVHTMFIGSAEQVKKFGFVKE